MISLSESRQQALVFGALSHSPGRILSLAELELATGLGQNAVKDIIRHFRESGVQIEEDGKQFALRALPDIILPAALVSGLKSRVMGHEIHSYKTIGSTNEAARRLADAGAPEGTLVVAEKQTRGRGRLGRSWHSPGGLGLYFSLVLRPQVNFNRLPALSMVAALSICRTVEDYGDLVAQIKWPNDCLLSGRKFAGILVELSAELDRVCYAILGIGMNVNNQTNDFPPRIRPKATSMAMELGNPTYRPDLLARVLNEFERCYGNFQRYGLRFMGPELVERSVVLHRRITVTAGRKRISGQALGFDENGALRIKTAEGVRTISAGEVTLR